ncbi:hypothetical protein OS190_03790 [Sulfitobacter sp. F26204]|uniref:hypothetical protein n=1 Tax=Sulfitobacter sp. F26204 TaxID=2996014 RepID=UPI00225E6A42|nr:hypothetical protein [Sulfitobacter sp. F26204]MCX7558675.1 hypothetical protein [Sulfitobacter sp. F26204]
MSNEAKQRAMIVIPFLEFHERARKDVREQSKSSCVNLLTAHQLAWAALISYQNRFQNVQFSTESQSILGRLGLISQFAMGVELVETSICEGLYPQAANLLKQALETLAAVEEITKDRRVDGRAPRFIGRLQNFGRRYGELNEIAHPTRSSMVDYFSRHTEGERTGASSVPRFNKEVYRELYGMQISLMVVALQQMREVFLELGQLDWDEAEVRLAHSATQILLDEGLIESAL